MKNLLCEPIYIVTLYRGENVNDVSEERESINNIGFKDRVIISVEKTEEKAIELKERYQRKANQYELKDYQRYFVEKWYVND